MMWMLLCPSEVALKCISKDGRVAHPISVPADKPDLQSSVPGTRGDREPILAGCSLALECGLSQ